jgi:integrase
MTLPQFFDNVYRPLRLRGRSTNTSRLYHATIAAYRRWLQAEGIAQEPALEHLEELLLARYLEHRASTRSPYTAEKERSQLMSLARLANERRLIDRLPTCPPGVLPDKVPTAWSADELRRLFQAASQARGTIAGVPASAWFPAAISLAFESGERIGALLDTKRADYRRPTLTVQPESRKGKRRGRVYALSDATCDRLDALAAAQGDKLLPWDKAPTYLYGRLRKILEAAGLSGKRIGFHQVRRSAISHIAAAGGDPVQFAGHANPAVTKRWYLDPRMTDRGPKPHEMLPRIDEPPPERRAGEAEVKPWHH